MKLSSLLCVCVSFVLVQSTIGQSADDRESYRRVPFVLSDFVAAQPSDGAPLVPAIASYVDRVRCLIGSAVVYKGEYRFEQVSADALARHMGTPAPDSATQRAAYLEASDDVIFVMFGNEFALVRRPISGPQSRDYKLIVNCWSVDRKEAYARAKVDDPRDGPMGSVFTRGKSDDLDVMFPVLQGAGLKMLTAEADVLDLLVNARWAEVPQQPGVFTTEIVTEKGSRTHVLTVDSNIGFCLLEYRVKWNASGRRSEVIYSMSEFDDVDGLVGVRLPRRIHQSVQFAGEDGSLMQTMSGEFIAAEIKTYKLRSPLRLRWPKDVVLADTRFGPTLQLGTFETGEVDDEAIAQRVKDLQEGEKRRTQEAEDRIGRVRKSQ